MQLPLLHLSSACCSFLSAALLHFSSPLSSISPPLLSTAWCSFLSSAALLSSISPLHAAVSSALQLSSISPLPISPLLHLSSPHLSPPLPSTAWCSFLSHLQLSSISPPRDAASSPLQLSSISPLPISPLLHLSSPHLSPPLPSTAWCSFLSPLQLSSISPPRDAASSPLQLSSISPLHISPLPISLVRCSPLRDAASYPRPSFAALLSSISPLLHLTPLLLSSSDLHCVMQLPVLLPHLQLSSPPPLSTAWCSFLSNSPPFLLSPISPLSHLSLVRCSPLRDAASSPPSSAALLSSISPPLSTAWCSFLSSSLICSSPPSLLYLSPLLLSSSDLHCVMQLPVLPRLQLSSPPSNSSAAISTARCSSLSSSLICSSPLLHLFSPPSNSSAALLLWSPLRDAASCPPSSAALLSSI